MHSAATGDRVGSRGVRVGGTRACPVSYVHVPWPLPSGVVRGSFSSYGPRIGISDTPQDHSRPQTLQCTAYRVLQQLRRRIARRTGARTVSISDLENGPSLFRGLTLLAPRVHPCRCSSGNRRALQGAAGRPDSVPGPHAASWRTPPQQSATPHSALHAALNHARVTQPSTLGPSFDET